MWKLAVKITKERIQELEKNKFLVIPYEFEWYERFSICRPLFDMNFEAFFEYDEKENEIIWEWYTENTLHKAKTFWKQEVLWVKEFYLFNITKWEKLKLSDLKL